MVSQIIVMPKVTKLQSASSINKDMLNIKQGSLHKMERFMSATDVKADIESTMNINVMYFASLADEANCQQETVSVQQDKSLIELYEQLSQKHRFSRPQAELRVAVNDYFAKWTDQINDGDSVVFITPVAGG